MQYKYCQNDNFEHFASGSVLINKSGMSNFPVRLAQEIYCRCLSYKKNDQDIILYDPFGGGGYLLTILGFLNMDYIRSIVYSDISDEMLKIAQQNLSLLSTQGLEKRALQLKSLYDLYGKDSHLQAIKNANILKDIHAKARQYPSLSIFSADMLDSKALCNANFKADIVLTDLPYNNLIAWQGDVANPINVFLDNLIPVLTPESIIAVCSDKHQKIKHSKYKRLEKQLIGKRKFEIMCLAND